MSMKVIWKKKVYDPPGYTGGIWQVEVDGDPVTMAEIHEWYGYANGREIHIVHIVPYVAPEYWVVELGREEEVKHPIFPHTMIFVTEKENAVNSVKEAKDQAEKWLELGA